MRTLPFALALLCAAPVAAQERKPDPYAQRDPKEQAAYLEARGEAYHRAPDSQQTAEELARTEALNAEIAARNAAAEAEEARSEAAYDEARALWEAETAKAETARLNHEEQVRAAQAAQAQHQRDMAAWEAQVRACRAGDRSACAPTP
jgi:hypothetical protein